MPHAYHAGGQTPPLDRLNGSTHLVRSTWRHAFRLGSSQCRHANCTVALRLGEKLCPFGLQLYLRFVSLGRLGARVPKPLGPVIPNRFGGT